MLGLLDRGLRGHYRTGSGVSGCTMEGQGQVMGEEIVVQEGGNMMMIVHGVIEQRRRVDLAYLLEFDCHPYTHPSSTEIGQYGY